MLFDLIFYIYSSDRFATFLFGECDSVLHQAQEKCSSISATIGIFNLLLCSSVDVFRILVTSFDSFFPFPYPFFYLVETEVIIKLVFLTQY